MTERELTSAEIEVLVDQFFEDLGIDLKLDTPKAVRVLAPPHQARLLELRAFLDANKRMDAPPAEQVNQWALVYDITDGQSVPIWFPADAHREYGQLRFGYIQCDGGWQKLGSVGLKE